MKNILVALHLYALLCIWVPPVFLLYYLPSRHGMQHFEFGFLNGGEMAIFVVTIALANAATLANATIVALLAVLWRAE